MQTFRLQIKNEKARKTNITYDGIEVINAKKKHIWEWDLY